MTPQGRQRFRRLTVLLILASQATFCAAADRSAGGSAPIHYYAIVGAVPVPATYSSDQSEVPLRDVVRRAGGMTGDASGGIRVIHRGRQHQDRHVCSPGVLPDTSSRVPSGAIIVVESSQTGAPGNPDVVHVACENLLERPAVLGGNAARMTLAQLLDALGQSRQSADSIQVLPRTLQLDSESRIPPGTVLVFDAAAIDRTALQRVLQAWPFEDVIPLRDDEDEPLTGNVVDARPREALEIPQEAAPRMAPDSRAETGESNAADTPAVPAHVPVVEQAQPVSPLPMVDCDHGAGNSRHSAGNSVQVQQAAALWDTPPDAIPKSDPGSLAPATAVAPDRDAGPPVARHRPARRFRSQVVYAASAAGGLAMFAMLGAVLWSRRERRRLRGRRQEMSEKLSGTGMQAAPSQRNTLDLLINDELPVVVEEVVLPEGTEFHGRAVGFRYLVRHEPQSLRGPHFETTSRTTNPTSEESVSQNGPPGHAGDGHMPANQHERRLRTVSSAASPLESALRTQHGETSR